MRQEILSGVRGGSALRLGLGRQTARAQRARPATQYRGASNQQDAAPRRTRTAHARPNKDRIIFADERGSGLGALTEHSPPYYGDALVVPASLLDSAPQRDPRNGWQSPAGSDGCQGYGPGGMIRYPCHRSGARTPPILKVKQCTTPAVEVCQGLLMQRVTLKQRRSAARGSKRKQPKSSWRRRWVSLHGSTLFIYEKESTWGLPPCDIVDLRPMVLELPRAAGGAGGEGGGTASGLGHNGRAGSRHGSMSRGDDVERRFKLTTAFACYQFQAPTAAARQAWVRTLKLVLRMQRQRISDGKRLTFKEAEFGHGPLGLHLAVRAGRIVVENCAPNSAASRRDIAVGDMIVAANGVPMEYSLTNFQTELQFLKTAPRPLRILLERVCED
jgi:hypothetical protein